MTAPPMAGRVPDAMLLTWPALLQTACSLVLKCFQYLQPLSCYSCEMNAHVGPFERITAWLWLRGPTAPGDHGSTCYSRGCAEKVRRCCSQSERANVVQVGRRRGPNRTATRGNHGQHRGSEDKARIQGGAKKRRGSSSCVPPRATSCLFRRSRV